jgi:hypothetical protein
MRSKLVISLLLLLLAGTTLVSAQDEAGDLLGRVNNLRASVGRGPYSFNGALSAAAQSQAQWIVDTGNVSHTHPDGSGPRTRALNAGYPSTQVSENIYGGTNANVDSAWVFWINSGIHYAGLVNAAYNEVGVGIAHGNWGAAYVLVFGNSGGPPPPPPQALGSSGSGSAGDSAAASAPPAYVLGLDEHGNIMHEVQPGDTLGDIALIYGYTWDDLPAMMALNGIGDVRDLEVGSVFLVPSRANASAPPPAEAAEATETPIVAPTNTTFSATSATITPFIALLPVQQATLVVTPLALLTEAAAPSAAQRVIATADSSSLPSLLVAAVSPTATPDSAAVALAVTAAPDQSSASTPPAPRNNTNQVIVIAVVVQLFIVVVAAAEFLRRARRGR